MKQWLTVLFLCTLVLQPAKAALDVFACQPEWAALVEQLAGEHAEVFTAVTAFQDVHYIQARPGLIAKVRQADLLVCTGADLEIGWLPLLLKRASNPKVLPGSRGYFLASDYVEMLNIPGKLDRAEGDVHPQGNPHIHLDPDNYLPIATALAERLQTIDPGNEAAYRSRTEQFRARWQNAMQDWQARARPLQGMPIVVYHDAWLYMNRWLDLDQVAELEPKPGIPPTSRHLSVVLKQMKKQPAKAIVRAPYQDERAVRWLQEHTGITSLELPYTVGGAAGADDLFGLFDVTIDLLLGANH